MRKCTTDGIAFSRGKGRRIEADFDGGWISTDGGALLLREADRRLGLLNGLAEAMADGREAGKVRHEVRTMLAQRVFGLAAGYEDGNDHATLRSDPLFQLLAERPVDPGRPLASPPTLCRWENAVDRPSLVRMAGVLVEAFIRSHTSAPEALILDFDATDDPVHGNQIGRFFHGYYDDYCFLPLYVFCGEHLLVAYLRRSNIDASRHAGAILKLLVERFHRVWPKVKIVVRGDSGFARWKLMRWCDRHGVGYILGLARNPVLERLAAPYAAEAQRRFEQTHEKQRHFAEVRYAAETWDRERRVIVKAEHLAEGPNTRFVITNLPGEPAALYDELYCQRGEMENRIKEQQLDLFADRTSCHEFLPNQFRLLLSAAAYVLLQTIRRVGLAGTELAAAQVGTLRTKLLKIGARIVVRVRRIVLHLASGFPWPDLLRTAVARLRAAPPPTSPLTLVT